MATKEYVKKDVYFTVLPCRKGERIYRFWDLLAIQICFGIGAWFFLIGSQTGMWLSAKQAIPAIIWCGTASRVGAYFWPKIHYCKRYFLCGYLAMRTCPCCINVWSKCD